MEKKNKIVFEADGVKLAVRKPTVKDSQEAQKVYNRAFRDAIESGAILSGKLDDYVKEHDLWNDEKEAKDKELQTKLNEQRRTISKGGFDKVHGKELALACKKTERELRQHRWVKNSLDANTAQSQAYSQQFNKLVSLCTVYNEDEKRYYETYEDYLDKQEEKVTQKASFNLMFLLNNLDPDAEKKLPENKFLLENKFVDNELRFINEEGKLVDEEGRLINEEGRFIDSDGNFVDRDGNKVDEDGNAIG